MRKDLAREVTALALPAAAQALLSVVIFFTDRLLLGRYDSEALGSMQISGPVLWSLFSVFSAFCAGLLAVVGRSVGAKDPERAGKAVVAAFGFAIITGVFVGLLCWYARGLISGAMTTGPEAVALEGLANSYMGIVLFATPFTLLGLAGTVTLQATGDTKTPMWISAICGAVNLSLSWLLIYGRFGLPELGIVGAAIGTVASFILLALLSIGVLLQGRHGLQLPPIHTISYSALKPVLKVAKAAYGEKLVFHTAFLIFAGYVGHLGAIEMSANQALIAIESLGFIVGGAFGIAGGALVAQKLGAEAPEEASACGWIAAALGTGTLTMGSILFVVFAEQLISFVDPNPEVIALAVPCLFVAAAAQPFMAVTDALSGSLRGAGDTRSPLIAALVGPCVVRLGLCWWLAFQMDLGLLGIWIGTTLDWITRAVFLIIVFRRGSWKALKV